MTTNQQKSLEAKIRRALQKSKEFKAFVDEYNKKMKYFHRYYNAVEIKADFTFRVSTHFLNSWNEEVIKEIRIPKKTTTRVTVLPLSDFCENNLNDLVKLYSQYIIDNYIIPDDHYHDIIKEIQIDIPYYYIDRITAWTDETVGIYYIEQECGEHWIELPKEPQFEQLSGTITL